MIDERDPFAPIDNSEATHSVATPNSEPIESTVVTPVPANVERVADAATRLMGRKPDDFWRYHDPDRRLLFTVVRWDTAGGKEIRPMCWVRQPDGFEDWAFKSHPVPRPLYRLNLLTKSPDGQVVIVEGEKCADVAKEVFLDSFVTTSPGGAHAAASADWTPLAQTKKVLIWPDADAAGRTYAQQVAMILHRRGVANIYITDTVALAGRTFEGVTREIPLGWDVANAIDEGWSAHQLRNAAWDFAKPWMPPTPLTDWPKDFKMTVKGLVKVTGGKDKNVEDQFTGPFDVVGEGRDRIGAGRGLWLAWRDRDDRDQRGFVRHADLVGSGVDWLKELTDRGFPGPIEHGRINWLRQALHGCRPAGRITMVRRTGWVGSAFVLPHKTIGETGGETIMFDGRADIARYGERGTLDNWRKSVAAPAAGNTRLIFALSAAFAGPIADLLEEESFGFNLTGPSSVGKSTALIAAGSIWGGGGPLGFAYSWRLTDNGAEGIACAHSGTFLPLDELGQLNADAATALTYMLGNGLGKGRAGRGGEARRPAEWRTIMLSTGEVGIAAKIEEAGHGRKAKAGSLVRLIDIPADPGKGFGLFDNCPDEAPAELAQRLKAAALFDYGSAGPALVAHLTSSVAKDPQFKAALRERIDLVQKSLLKGIDTGDGQVIRVARHFAVVAVAGDLARVSLNLPWDEEEPISAPRICLKAWMSQRGGSGPQEILTAVTALRDAVEIHGQARFGHLHGPDENAFEDSDSPRIRDLLGFRFEFERETVWGFTTAGLKEVLRGVGDFQTLVSGLVELSVVRRGPGRIQTEKKIGGKKWRLYAVIHSSLFKDDEQR